MLVRIKCTECKATGVYCGSHEPKGVGKVCAGCKGKGYIEGEQFQGRQRCIGINSVRTHTGNTLAYAKFLETDIETLSRS